MMDPQPYNSLTPEEADHFLTHGWIKVENAIEPQYIERFMKDFWVRLNYDEHDKSTWKEEYVSLTRHREVRMEEFCPKAWGKIIDIVGGEDRLDPVRERYAGDAFIINLGTEERAKETPIKPQDKNTWHIDDDWYRLFLDSSGNALTVIHCYTDILGDNGGGTTICEDGLKGVVQRLYDHPEGFDPPIDHMGKHCKDCKQFVTMEAKKGDIIIMHGLLPHTASHNHRHYARVIANPHVSLHSPHNLNRPDGNYSLIEQVILKNLGRDSVPEFKPTRERVSWHPRNAGFKLARVPDELERMKAAAKAKGLGEDSVDSVWLRGGEELKAMQHRNGFDRPVNDQVGLLMKQHGLV